MWAWSENPGGGIKTRFSFNIDVILAFSSRMECLAIGLTFGYSGKNRLSDPINVLTVMRNASPIVCNKFKKKSIEEKRNSYFKRARMPHSKSCHCVSTLQ